MLLACVFMLCSPLTSQRVPASPLDIWVGPEIQAMCLGLQPFDPRGINVSWQIGCEHNGMGHPAWGVCCTASLRCDINAYCCWDIYWIKVDDAGLDCFSQLQRQIRKKAALREQKTWICSLYMTNDSHAYLRSLTEEHICFCSSAVIKTIWLSVLVIENLNTLTNSPVKWTVVRWTVDLTETNVHTCRADKSGSCCIDFVKINVFAFPQEESLSLSVT